MQRNNQQAGRGGQNRGGGGGGGYNRGGQGGSQGGSQAGNQGGYRGGQGGGQGNYRGGQGGDRGGQGGYRGGHGGDRGGQGGHRGGHGGDRGGQGGYRGGHGGDRGPPRGGPGGPRGRGGRGRGGPAQRVPRIDPNADLEKMEKALITTPIGNPVMKKGLAFRTKEIETNYLPIFLDKLPDTIHQYHIKFDPETPKKMLKDAFELYMKKYQKDFKGKAAFDGVTLVFTSEKMQQLPDGDVTVAPQGAGKSQRFKISLQETATVNMRDLKIPGGDPERSAVQCMEVILRTAGDSPQLFRNRRTVFNPAAPKLKFSDGFHELWIGLFQSFVSGEAPFLNVDVSHKVYPGSMSVIELYTMLEKKGKVWDMNKILRGLDLIYTNPTTKEEKKCKFGALCEAATKEQFRDKDGNYKTIAQYYQELLRRPLRFPTYPVIKKANSHAMYPIEFLTIPPLQNRAVPPNIEAETAGLAASTTNVRKQRILDLLTAMNYKNDVIKKFGIRIGEKFTSVDSHILNDRAIQYADSKTVQVKQGEWKMDKEQFIETSKTPIKWAVLNLCPNIKRMQVEAFMKALQDHSKKNGLNLHPKYIYSDDKMEDGIRIFKEKGADILFVIVRGFMRNNSEDYPPVKQMAELQYGLLTSCVLEKTVIKFDNSIISNILLKVNAKLKGFNHFVLPDKLVATESIGNKWMVIGADVTHPSPQENAIPSVVGVTASFDEQGFKYNCQWRLQPPRREIIDDFEEIVVSQIKDFERARGFLPEKILYFRDGVSEGQFAQVSGIELNAMKKACRRMKCNAAITIIIVQKRHHTRFFPKEQNPNDKKNNNVEPGTVVDSKIVNPLRFTFFLVSHKSIQGVAKPTKYAVIHDESNIPAEELQVFTYGLCHMFARCNRVVSYPAPTYYAHLMAYRGRIYIRNTNLDMRDLKREYQNRMIKDDLKTGNPMFFV